MVFGFYYCCEVGRQSQIFTVFDIVKLIKNVFKILKIQEKNISLGFDSNYVKPILVFADEEKIQQFLVNTIKYGKKRGITEVSIENLTDKKVIVRITDSGKGIEKNNISPIFERYYRIDKSESRDEGSFGLGLSIVKYIIESHNERIYIENQYKIVSEFHLHRIMGMNWNHNKILIFLKLFS